MHKIKFYFSFITLLVFSSCKYSKQPKIFETKKVSIQYPSYLSKTNTVYPTKNTLLQLKNDYRDVYFILVDHGLKPGNQGFDILYDSITQQLIRNLKEPNIETKDSTFMINNNLKVREMQVSGILSSTQQDHRFLFLIDIFEDNDGHIYHTAGWLLRHKRQLWLNDLKQTAHSFKAK